EELQRLMYVARVRAVGEGREDYNYTYDLFVHRYPETVRAAERASSADAMSALLAHLLGLSGGVTERQVTTLFDWSQDRVAQLTQPSTARRSVCKSPCTATMQMEYLVAPTSSSVTTSSSARMRARSACMPTAKAPPSFSCARRGACWSAAISISRAMPREHS